MRIYAKFHHEFECLWGKSAKDGSPSLIVPVLSPQRIYVSLHVGRADKAWRPNSTQPNWWHPLSQEVSLSALLGPSAFWMAATGIREDSLIYTACELMLVSLENNCPQNVPRTAHLTNYPGILSPVDLASKLTTVKSSASTCITASWTICQSMRRNTAAAQGYHASHPLS